MQVDYSIYFLQVLVTNNLCSVKKQSKILLQMVLLTAEYYSTSVKYKHTVLLMTSTLPANPLPVSPQLFSPYLILSHQRIPQIKLKKS